MYAALVAGRESVGATLTSRLGLDDLSLAWPAVVQLFVFIYSGTQKNCHEYSLLFITVINLFFLCFRFDALTELDAFMRTEC